MRESEKGVIYVGGTPFASVERLNRLKQENQRLACELDKLERFLIVGTGLFASLVVGFIFCALH